MKILIIFFLINQLALTIPVRIRVYCDGVPVNRAKVIIKDRDRSLEKISKIDGTTLFDLDSNNMFVQVIKDGYTPKGYYGKASDTAIHIKAKRSNLSGRLISHGRRLSNQKIEITSQDGKKMITETDSDGKFTLMKIPLLQHKHLLEVLDSSLESHKYAFIFRENMYLELSVAPKLKRVNIQLNGAHNSNRYVLVDKTSRISDANGFVSVLIESRENLKIFVNNRTILKKIEDDSDNINISIDIDN